MLSHIITYGTLLEKVLAMTWHLYIHQSVMRQHRACMQLGIIK
jgi:hypothetical protein